MKHRAYSDATIRRSLARFEFRYEISSNDFYEAYKADSDAIAHIDGFDQRQWESLYEEYLEDRGEPMAVDTGQLQTA